MPASSRAAATMSFLAAPGSRTTRVWQAKRIAAATTARRAAAVGPADAPGGEEADREPAEVEEQRERVAADQQDPDRVQELRVLRVEPVGEDRLDVVHPGRRVALRDVRRERHVVPERVEVEDAAVEGVLGGHRPGEDDDRDHRGHRQQAASRLRAAAPGRRCGRSARPARQPLPEARRRGSRQAARTVPRRRGRRRSPAPRRSRSAARPRPATSTSRAAPPSQPGSSRARSRTALKPERRDQDDELDRGEERRSRR